MSDSKSSDDSFPSTNFNHVDPRAERRLLLKLDLVIFPIFMVIYMLAFLDRINVGNAKIQGMVGDLNLHGQRFNVALFIFYVSYILLEAPSNLLLKKVRPSLYLSIVIFCCGILNMCMGFVKSYSGLLCLRFILGGFEAGVFPGMIYITSMYYKRHELQKRMAALVCSAALAGAFGGLLAYLITTSLDGRHGIAGWRWIFIVEGSLTAGIALLCPFIVIDWPEQTKVLNDDEKKLLRQRLAMDNKYPCSMDTLNKFSLQLILKDYKIWLAGVLYFGINVAGLSSALFLPTILHEFKYTPTESQIRTIPIYIVGVSAMLLTSWASDRIKHRYGFLMSGYAISIVGYGMLLGLDGHSREYKLGAVFVVFIGTTMNTPMALTWLQNNLSGHWKRASGAAIQVAIGNLAGLVASNIFIEKEMPGFITGYSICIACTILSAVCATALAALMWRENKGRDAGHYDDRLTRPKEETDNMGDWHPSFRFTF